MQFRSLNKYKLLNENSQIIVHDFKVNYFKVVLRGCLEPTLMYFLNLKQVCSSRKF